MLFETASSCRYRWCRGPVESTLCLKGAHEHSASGQAQPAAAAAAGDDDDDDAAAELNAALPHNGDLQAAMQVTRTSMAYMTSVACSCNSCGEPRANCSAAQLFAQDDGDEAAGAGERREGRGRRQVETETRRPGDMERENEEGEDPA